MTIPETGQRDRLHPWCSMAGDAPDLPLSNALQSALETDVLIVGGGMVGLTLAISLAQVGVRSVVVERAERAQITAAEFDGRATAIAFAPYQMLQAIGAWPGLAPHAQAINEIRVSDGRLGAQPQRRVAPLFLHFDHHKLGDEPFGFMVENRHIQTGLWSAAQQRPEITLCAPARIEDLTCSAGGVRATIFEPDNTPAGSTNSAVGHCVQARLVVGADGRNSTVRAAAEIGCNVGSYDQTAIVATVAHERAHGGIAEEFFLPAGPFAILPLADLPDGTHRSSLVWTETTATAKSMLALGATAFQNHMAERFGDHLGDVVIAGPRWSYPLGYLQADRYVDEHLALVGDAAHGIHPIAGQGLNLGLRDVAALAEVLADGVRLGMDLGSAPLLNRYQRWRRFDGLVLLAATDGLNRLFSNDVTLLRWARDLGLAAVNRAPRLKRFFMRHARGTVGAMPRLLKGEAL